MLTLQPQEIYDIVNSLTFKAKADREAAQKLQGKTTEMGHDCLVKPLLEQAARQDALADKLLDLSLVEVEPC